MTEQQRAASFPLNIDLTFNGQRLDAEHRLYGDPSYNRQPAAAPAARGMSGWAIAAIAICACAAFIAVVTAYTVNSNYTMCTSTTCIAVANDRIAADKEIRTAQITAEKEIRVANAQNDALRIHTEGARAVAQAAANAKIAQANATASRDVLNVVDRMVSTPVQTTPFRGGFVNAAYTVPAAPRSYYGAPSARVPTPMEIYQKVAHKTTYQCVACAPGMGYVQDPVTCGCSGGNLTWHAGPPPAD